MGCGLYLWAWGLRVLSHCAHAALSQATVGAMSAESWGTARQVGGALSILIHLLLLLPSSRFTFPVRSA